jgi:predicted AlkP superfamily phosphohydrolase/phosphomutase
VEYLVRVHAIEKEERVRVYAMEKERVRVYAMEKEERVRVYAKEEERVRDELSSVIVYIQIPKFVSLRLWKGDTLATV